jgi:hypothetical protein
MSVKEAKSRDVRDMPGRFAELAGLLPPHVIRDERDYDKVMAFLDRLLCPASVGTGVFLRGR